MPVSRLDFMCQDVAIIGTANEPSICNSPYPALTSIDMDFEELAIKQQNFLIA